MLHVFVNKAVQAIGCSTKSITSKLSKIIKQISQANVKNPKLKWIIEVIIKELIKRVIDLLST